MLEFSSSLLKFSSSYICCSNFQAFAWIFKQIDWKLKQFAWIAWNFKQFKQMLEYSSKAAWPCNSISSRKNCKIFFDPPGVKTTSKFKNYKEQDKFCLRVILLNLKNLPIMWKVYFLLLVHHLGKKNHKKYISVDIRGLVWVKIFINFLHNLKLHKIILDTYFCIFLNYYN